MVIGLAGGSDIPSQACRVRDRRPVTTVVSATDLPVGADLENRFGDVSESVAETIKLAAEAKPVISLDGEMIPMPAHVVVNVEVTNPARYQDYLRQVNTSVEAYGGRYLIRGGRTEVLEGDYRPHRFVVVEFPDAAHAQSWWNSREYAPVKKIRQESAKTDMFIVDGV